MSYAQKASSVHWHAIPVLSDFGLAEKMNKHHVCTPRTTLGSGAYLGAKHLSRFFSVKVESSAISHSSPTGVGDGIEARGDRNYLVSGGEAGEEGGLVGEGMMSCEP